MKPAFLITIDTEGDDLWSCPKQVKTENARYLPRFQDLCNRFRFPPTYLTNYEMVKDDYFASWAKDVLGNGNCEIGMHLHAWDSPPIKPLTQEDHVQQPFIFEYGAQLLAEKMKVMTDELEQRFDTKMISHRSGRWGFNELVAHQLVVLGYEVDCSVTPGVNWHATKGLATGNGGPDFSKFPDHGYLLDPDKLDQHTDNAPLVELPVTIERQSINPADKLARRIPGVRGLRNTTKPEFNWLRPNGKNKKSLLNLVRNKVNSQAPYIEFILHSSEFMPGANPHFQDASSINKLYHDMEELFELISEHFEGATTSGFARQFRAQFHG